MQLLMTTPGTQQCLGVYCFQINDIRTGWPAHGAHIRFGFAMKIIGCVWKAWRGDYITLINIIRALLFASLWCLCRFQSFPLQNNGSV